MINKPINPYPYNCCVDATKNIEFGYEIPNNEIIDGCYSWVSDLKTGEVREEIPPELTTPSNGVTFVVNTGELANNKEYVWQSLYWKTPTSTADKYWTVTSKNDTSGVIRVLPDGTPEETIVPTYKAHSYFNTMLYNVNCICDDITTYDQSLFESCDHTIGDDTSAYCPEGTLEDYFGYTCFYIGVEFVNNIKNIGLGKCIMNIYKDNRLVSRARCLAYDHYGRISNTTFDLYVVIIDNDNFESELIAGCGEGVTYSYKNNSTSASHDGKYYPYSKAEFYNVDDLNKQDVIDGIIFDESQICVVRNCKYLKYEYELSTNVNIASGLKIGDTIGVWSHNCADYNESPAYYFRTKEAPSINITQSKLQSAEGVNTLSDIKCEFGISYTSTGCNLNYFYLYLYAFNPELYMWELKERSPMLFDMNNTHEFTGLVDGQKYKVMGVCTDTDGDEWNTDDLEFVVNKPTASATAYSSFNENTATIDILLNDILKSYKTASLEFYKVLKTDENSTVELEYAGGGLAKSDEAVYFDKWSDYNIKNDSYYDYYLRVNYTGKESDADMGVDLWLVASDIHTDFEGTSILGLEKSNGTQLSIAHSFNLFYHFDNNSMDLKNEISREYLNSFGRYPKELKGNQNYISGSCSGLLGGENKGIYEEPRGIRDKWNNFINDDTIKLYRGIDGETMIISIDSSSVKPYQFSGVGLVNEVKITFKEIASTKQYAIFTTEKMGG